jgi:hypothetical protein
MSSAAMLTFAVIAGLVWGGLILIVAKAVRSESRKSRG